MELLNTFGFGRLIKTVIPGFVIYLTICAYLDLAARAAGGPPIVLPFLWTSPIPFLGFAVPFAVLLGVLSNTVFFAVLSPMLIESHHRTCDAAFCQYEDEVKTLVKKVFAKRLLLSPDVAETFQRHADASSLLMASADLSKIGVVRESFWYYLEFQVNILLALWFAVPAIVWIGLALGPGRGLTPSLVAVAFATMLLVMFLVSQLLLTAARKNYSSYRSKRLSALLATASLADPIATA